LSSCAPLGRWGAPIPLVHVVNLAADVAYIYGRAPCLAVNPL
jgi:hypothetical protein